MDFSAALVVLIGGPRGETEPDWGTISRFYDARYRLTWCIRMSVVVA
jgi:hypothetical protein